MNLKKQSLNNNPRMASFNSPCGDCPFEIIAKQMQHSPLILLQNITILLPTSFAGGSYSWVANAFPTGITLGITYRVENKLHLKISILFILFEFLPRSARNSRCYCNTVAPSFFAESVSCAISCAIASKIDAASMSTPRS